MATTSNIVNTLGAGSGIDIKGLAQSLVDAEKTPKKERIDAKIAQSEAKITGYSAIKYALSELKTAFGKLNDASDFSSIKPSNTQPAAFGVTASSTAEAGSYSIEVLHTALAQRTPSSIFVDRAEQLNVVSPATTGTAFSLNLSVGGVSKGAINVTNPTPAGMVSAINGAKLGVTAQLINTGNGYQVVVTGETGADQAFSLTSDDGTGTAVSGVEFGVDLQSATNASFKVNGLTVSRSNNTVTDVIDGVTLDLYANTTGAARLDLNRDTAGIKDNIKGLVTAYNDFEESLKVLGDRSSEVKDFGGVLAGESLLESVRSQVRAMVTNNSSTPGTHIKAARDVGLSLDRYGKLNLDEGKLDTALQNNFGEVSTLFSAGTNNQSIYSPAPAGLAGDAINKIEKMLLSNGNIATQSANATTKIAQYKEELVTLEARMEKMLNRYMSQFSVMESIVGNSNSTREGLTSTFKGMMAAYNN
ncbi:flagellar filament capping protein FliD [Limnohabitans sp. Rim47]|uniref:flagellar filament capping protein FliD n=1 Tax=Limnohabitans sp. Rim47 TaxID=1100721 RepID=UPI0003094DA5|nr:flagellar filament capping protein FliD [Limnohabitans sp. Rim47]